MTVTEEGTVVAPSALREAAADWREGFQRHELWTTFAWNDVRSRYRRSRLGQFWITLSVFVFIGAVGVFYSAILHTDLTTYFPYLTVGYVLWLFLLSAITEGGVAYTSATGLMIQGRVPLSLIMLRCVYRNLIVLAHNAVIIPVVFVIFHTSVSWSALLAIPGLLLDSILVFWIGLLLGALSARFRDVPQMTASLMTVVFLITPILWQADALSEQVQHLVARNPFTYMLNVVRQPLLGELMDPRTWWIVVIMALGGLVVSFFVFARFRARVPYWL